MKNFDPPADTYGHNSMGVSDAEWKARVDLAAAYRLCVYYGLHEGIVNHLTVRFPAGQTCEVNRAATYCLPITSWVLLGHLLHFYP